MVNLCTYNIRQRWFIFCVSLVMIMLSGCNTDDESAGPDSLSNTVSVRSYIGSENNVRTINNTFETGDAIGIFASVSNFSDSYKSNNQYIYNRNSDLWNSNDLIPWYNLTSAVTLYAYYPYNENILASENYQFNIKPDQSKASDLSYSDFLWAKSSSAIPTSNKIPLVFHHKLSRIILNIKAGKGIDAEQISTVSILLKNVLSSISVDIGTGVATDPDSPVANLKPHRWNSANSLYDATYECIVVPQNIVASTNLFSIELDDEPLSYTYSTENTILLESGREYTFNITLNRHSIKVETGAILNWNTGKEITTYEKDPLPKVIDLDAIDWNNSLVYKASHQGTQIAEITREYLYNHTINAQAIVIYPVLEGKTDYNKGFVARMMIEESNHSYSIDQASVHGGQLSWGTNSIFSYIAGNQSEIRYVGISKEGTLTGENNPAQFSIRADLEPDLAIDANGLSYKTVKIGMQYWLAEDLKTTKYADGADLTYVDNIFIKFGTEGYTSNGAKHYYSKSLVFNGTTKIMIPMGYEVPSAKPNGFHKLLSYLQLGTSINPGYGNTTVETVNKLKKYDNGWPTVTSDFNVTGFGALPNGRFAGSWYENSSECYYWTDVAYQNAAFVWLQKQIIFQNNNNASEGQSSNNDLLQIRCVKDIK